MTRTVTVALRATTSEFDSAFKRSGREVKTFSDDFDRRMARNHRSLFTFHRGAALLTGGIAAGLGGVVVASVKSAAAFDTTMRQIAVATNAPASSVEGLRKLALKMGADTVFSAQDAGAAMLELAKGGLSEAQIRAGALASTLTLASAGGLDLGTAAGYIVQGLSTFNLKADKSAAVAAALAGGANASTASVEDMGLALSQVGPGAQLAGLSLQETTGVLAAFAQNGIKGSDAGTSLKTMLSRLVPQTKSQADAMKTLGLKFTDAKGHFLGVDEIAQQLHDHLGGLSQAQRTSALNTIFGSDASRAAAVLMKEGAKGVRDYTKATSDKTQADKLAKAATSGTAGALSQLSGSIDTAKLQLGDALAPIVRDLADHMTVWANDLSTDVIPVLSRFIDGMEKGTGPGGKFRDVLDEVGGAAGDAWNTAQPIFGFIGDHPHLFGQLAKDGLILAAALKAMSVVKSIPALGGILGRGGRGGVGGAVTSGGPVPVYVTNMGAGGLPGGGPTVVGGGLPNGGNPKGMGLMFPGAFPDLKSADDSLGQVKNALQKLLAMQLLNAARSNKISGPEANSYLKSFNLQKDGSVGNLPAAYAFLQRYGAKTKEVQAALHAIASDHIVAQQLKAKAAAIQSALEATAAAAGRAGAHSGKQYSDQLGRSLAGGVAQSSRKVTALNAIHVKPRVALDDHDALLEVDAIRRSLAALHDKNVNVNIGVTGLTGLASRVDLGTDRRKATGGEITGPGTGTSDTAGLFRLSNGEFVVKASRAQRHLSLLRAINDAPGYADGGLIGGMAGGGPVNFDPRHGTLAQQSRWMLVHGRSADDIRALTNAYDDYLHKLDQAVQRQRLLHDLSAAKTKQEKAAARQAIHDFDVQAYQDKQKARADADTAWLERKATWKQEQADKKATAAQKRADALALSYQIQDNKFSLGLVSAKAEEDSLTKRMGLLTKYSDEWMSLYQQRQQILDADRQSMLDTVTVIDPARTPGHMAGMATSGYQVPTGPTFPYSGTRVTSTTPAGSGIGVQVNGGISLVGTQANPQELVRELSWAGR